MPPVPASGEDLEPADQLGDSLQAYPFPNIKTLVKLWNQCLPEALQIQFWVTGFVVELPKVSLEEYVQRMARAVMGIRSLF